MSFHVVLTFALLLTSLMGIDATPVNQAERSAMLKSRIGPGNECEPWCSHCHSPHCNTPESLNDDTCNTACAHCHLCFPEP
uniref:Gsp_16 putative toxin n=1 Tax=Gemmula speciosa TaxID=439592 RepID=A0A098LW93_GEMSP